MEGRVERKSKEEVLALMEPLVSDWFRNKFRSLTEPQAYAIPLIHQRESVLVSSPTGSGKTLTAFLSIINELFRYAKEGRLEDRIYAVYVSPLKALANDINRNLRQPLREMRELARARGEDFPEIRVGVRSGDTSSYERQKMLRKPPHIFITTPESLALVLVAPKFRERFSRVEWVIVDEIHEICDSKRGVHLSLTLERLQEHCERPFVRVGLSATLAPMEEIAAFLAGFEDGKRREIYLVEADAKKDLDLRVICPAEGMNALPYEIVNAKMYDTLKDLIEEHTTTLVFTNTRSATESVVFKLKERGVENIEAHHGSLSKEIRLDVEERLKRGELKCVVSSTSLELGIDIGSVDLVCQIGSPKSVAKGLQRIGRSGHGYGQTAKGRLLAMDKDDLVECAVLSRAAHEGRVDRVSIPENCLDVLAQNLVGMSVEKRWDIEEAFRVVRRSYCYRNLNMETFMEVLRYLGGLDEFEGIYPKIWLDLEEGRFGRKKGSRMIYSMNIGTIPEEATYSVYTENGRMVGDLSEKFAERLSPGDIFVLAGRSYEFRRIRGLKVFVREAQGRKPTVPSWAGEMLPRSFDLSLEVAGFRRELAERLDRNERETVEWLCREFHIDGASARAVIDYFREQRAACHVIPDDRRLAIEGYIDMSGRYNVIFHFPFGRRVNDALSRAYAFQITRHTGCNVSVSVTDDAFMITSPRKVELGRVVGIVSSTDLESVLRKAVRESELFKQRFRHNAARSFMILRAYKGRQVSLSRQQARSSALLETVSRAGRFPVVEETFREILRDVMDVENARRILRWIEEGKMDVAVIDYSTTPSPFAHNVILTGISDLVLMEDRSTLIRELHRKVLAKVMGGELSEFEFDEERVSSYFREKAPLVRTKGEIPGLLARTGPLRIFREHGRTIYPYVMEEKSVVDMWAGELLREGAITSVYLDDCYFINKDDLPIYAAIFRKERELGEFEERLLEYLEEGHTVKELAELTGASPERVTASLRRLESAFLVERSGFDGRRWFYRRREVEPYPRERALDIAITRMLELSGPATLAEISYSLGLEEGEVERALDDLVREGILVKGYFVISEHPQYMLERDYLRLKADSRRAFDIRTVSAYRTRKLEACFGSIRECLSFFAGAGLPYDVYTRVPSFKLEDWERLREEGTVLLGRFLNGKVRYVLADDAPMFVAAYRKDELTPRDLEILDLITRHGELTLRQLLSLTSFTRQQVRESLDRLDRNMYVIRKFDNGDRWSSENIYARYDAPLYEGDPVREIVRRFIRAYGPVPLRAIHYYTGFGIRKIREVLSSPDVEVITAGGDGTEMYLMADELEELETAMPEQGKVRVRSLYDPVVQPMWAEISARYGDRWVFPLVRGSQLVGVLEKWGMGGYIEVRQIDLQDASLLPEVLDAIEEMMRYHRMEGTDVLRITEVMGKPVPELGEEVLRLFEKRGYSVVGDSLVWGRIIPETFTWDEILARVFRRQGLSSDTKYGDVMEAIRAMRGLRSDAEACSRCLMMTPLKRLQEQHLVERVNAIPGFITYTQPATAALFARAKALPLTEEMISVLEILRDRGPLWEEELYNLSLVGRKSTRDILLALHKGGYIFRDHRGKLHPVPEIDMDVHEARKEVIRGLFRNFGIFTAEDLQRFTLNAFSMREIRSILAELEDEGFLVKGFFLEGKPSMYWMLREELDLNDTPFTDSFVLTPEDNLYHYLRPWIKRRYEGMPSLIFRGVEVIGIFNYRRRGSDIFITRFEGEREARTVLNNYVKKAGLTLRGEETEIIPDWEIQEFYEKVHPGV